MTTGYPHSLNAIYAKYAAEAENELDPLWTRRLLTPAMTLALAWPARPIQRRLSLPINKETALLNAARSTGLPSPAAAKMLAKQDRLIARARKLRPDLRFERIGITGPSYAPFTRTVYAPTTKPEIMAHELGHSLNDATWRRLFDNKRGIKYPVFLKHKLPRYGNLASLALMMSADKNIRDAAPWVAAASHVPTLTGELLASIRGMKNYRRGLGVTGRIRPYGNLARALSTYLIESAAMPLSMWATNKLNDTLYKK